MGDGARGREECEVWVIRVLVKGVAERLSSDKRNVTLKRCLFRLLEGLECYKHQNPSYIGE